MSSIKKIGVTILTGALGSGKTTFLNKMLQQYPERRFVVVENELGEVGIDGKLISLSGKNHLIEISDGCICCNLGNDLGKVLQSLILAKSSYDYLVIESTGVADPSHFAKLFLSGTRVSKYFSLNSIVCIIDAKYFFRQLEQVDEVKKQILAASRVFINKADMVSEKKIADITSAILELNHSCTVSNSFNGMMDDQGVLSDDRNYFDYYEKSFEKFFSFKDQKLQSQIRIHQHNPHHSHHLESVTVCLEGPINHKALELWLEYFTKWGGKEIYRCKGIVNAEESEIKLLFHGIYDTLLFSDGAAWQEDEERNSCFVFIGKKLEKEAIVSGLESTRSRINQQVKL